MNSSQRQIGLDFVLEQVNTMTPFGEDAWQDFLADERPNPEEAVGGSHDSRQRSRWLASSLAELSEREQTIIRERRLCEQGRTLEELGARLGISKERVRRSRPGRFQTSPQQYWVTSSCMSMLKSVAFCIDASTYSAPRTARRVARP